MERIEVEFGFTRFGMPRMSFVGTGMEILDKASALSYEFQQEIEIYSFGILRSVVNSIGCVPEGYDTTGFGIEEE